MSVLLLLLALVSASFAAVAYAHWTLRLHTVGMARVKFMRSVLAIVGVVFGYVTVRHIGDTLPVLLVFLLGFGAVHVPAAAILFRRRFRDFGKS